MKIYIGNLSFQATEDDLMELFQTYGELGEVKIVLDQQTGKPRGFAFVQIDDDSAANAAIEELNGKEFMGRKLVVNEARPKNNSGGGGRRGGGGHRGGGHRDGGRGGYRN